jgi:hypothetical protein
VKEVLLERSGVPKSFEEGREQHNTLTERRSSALGGRKAHHGTPP